MPIGTVGGHVVALTTIACGECGGVYAICERYRQQKFQESGFWTCPYCKCSWGYGGSENQQLKKQLAAERAAHDQTRSSLKTTERRRRAAVGQHTKLKHRIEKGLCPCCNRHFANLAQHLHQEHPDFLSEEAEPEASN